MDRARCLPSSTNQRSSEEQRAVSDLKANEYPAKFKERGCEVLCSHLGHIILLRQRSTPFQVTCLMCFIHHDHSLYPVQLYFHTGLVLLHHAVVSQYYSNE